MCVVVQSMINVCLIGFYVDFNILCDIEELRMSNLFEIKLGFKMLKLHTPVQYNLMNSGNLVCIHNTLARTVAINILVSINYCYRSVSLSIVIHVCHSATNLITSNQLYYSFDCIVSE